MTTTSTRPRFPTGQLLITPAAQQAIPTADVNSALQRHLAGDWGDCDPEDAAANDRALAEGGRLFSVYHTPAGEKLWIITEADRSATTILLPDDY